MGAIFLCFRSGGAGGCGGVKTPPYGAIDTWAVMARLRAGHARPLRTAVNGLRTRGAREGGSPPLCSGRVVARLRVVTQGPSESPSHLTVTALRARTPLSLRDISPRSGESPLKGEPFARAKPAREASPSGEVAAKQAGGVFAVRGGRSRRGQDPSLRCKR